jgi:hypothetical protein
MNRHEEFRRRILQRTSDSKPVEQAPEDEVNCCDLRTPCASQKLEKADETNPRG